LGDGATSCCFSTYNSVFEWRRLWRGLAIGVLQNCSWCAWIDKSPSPSPRSSITTTQLPQKHVDGFFFFTKDSATMSEQANNPTNSHSLTHLQGCKARTEEFKIGFDGAATATNSKGWWGSRTVASNCAPRAEWWVPQVQAAIYSNGHYDFSLPPPACSPPVSERERKSTMAVWHIAGCLVKKDRDRVCM
jgi:hypothetical protein